MDSTKERSTKHKHNKRIAPSSGEATAPGEFMQIPSQMICVVWIIMAFQILISAGSSFSPFHSIFCCFHGDGGKRDKHVVVCSSLSQRSLLTLRLPYVRTSLNTMAEDGEIRTQYKRKSLWQLFTFTVTCWQWIRAKVGGTPPHPHT